MGRDPCVMVRKKDPGHQNDHKVRGFEFFDICSRLMFSVVFDIRLVCTVRQQSVLDRSVIGVLIVIPVILSL